MSSLAEIDEVQLALQTYKATFTRFRNFPTEETMLAAKIREQGDRLTALTEELIVREHQTIHRLLAFIRNTLLIVLPFCLVEELSLL